MDHKVVGLSAIMVFAQSTCELDILEILRIFNHPVLNQSINSFSPSAPSIQMITNSSTPAFGGQTHNLSSQLRQSLGHANAGIVG